MLTAAAVIAVKRSGPLQTSWQRFHLPYFHQSHPIPASSHLKGGWGRRGQGDREGGDRDRGRGGRSLISVLQHQKTCCKLDSLAADSLKKGVVVKMVNVPGTPESAKPVPCVKKKFQNWYCASASVQDFHASGNDAVLQISLEIESTILQTQAKNRRHRWNGANVVLQALCQGSVKSLNSKNKK